MRSIYRMGSATLVAVLALCAIAAASASAVQWNVAGKALTGSSKLAEATKAEENIVLSVPAAELAITCTGGVKLKAGEIVSPSALKAEDVKLEGCKTTTPAKGCEIESTTIFFINVEGAVEKGTSPEDKIKFKPKTGTQLGEFNFNEGDTCALLGFGVMKGTFTLGMPKGQEELAEQPFAGLGTKESPKGFTIGGQTAYITGKFAAKLTAGSKWSYSGTEEKKEEEKKSEPATWYSGGKALTGSSKLAEATKAEENIVLSVPAAELAITCSGGVKLKASEIVAPSALKAEGIKLEGCKTTTPATGCEIEGPTIPFFGVEGAVEKGTSPEDRIKFKPKTGTVLGEFNFSETDRCAFQGFGVMKGTFTLGMPKGQEELAEQPFAGLGTKESPKGFTIGGQTAYITGKFAAKLTTGAKWSAH